MRVLKGERRNGEDPSKGIDTFDVLLHIHMPHSKVEMEKTRVRVLTHTITIFAAKLFSVEMEKTRVRVLTHHRGEARWYESQRRNGEDPSKGIDTPNEDQNMISLAQ